MMLQVQHLEVNIAAAQVLRGVSLNVPRHAMVGLVGSNGAGKTTFLRSVMGLVGAHAGKMIFDDADLGLIPAHRRANIGIGYMPEDRRLVPGLTVEENILLPAWATTLPNSGTRLDQIYLLLPEVAAFAGRKAIQLSGGQQKLTAFARALMVSRSLLLLDEPFEGVAPVLAQRLVDVLVKLKEKGLSVLLAESDSRYSSNLVDHLYVIERGKIQAE